MSRGVFIKKLGETKIAILYRTVSSPYSSFEIMVIVSTNEAHVVSRIHSGELHLAAPQRLAKTAWKNVTQKRRESEI
jgi:hypothetical protein